MLVCQVAHKIYANCLGALFHEACTDRRRRWPWHHWHVSTKVTMAARLPASSCLLIRPAYLWEDLRLLLTYVRWQERALALLL